MGLMDMINARQTSLVVTKADKLPAQAVSRQIVPVEKLPAQTRAKADERLKFVQFVKSIHLTEKIPLPKAVVEVAQRYGDTFNILNSAGKNGMSTLTYNNYRNWSALIKNKSRTEIRQTLADGYRRGVQPAKGDDRFWKHLYSSYLSENQLPATIAYDVAVKRLRMDDPEIIPPTLHQARYRLSQLDADIRTLGKFGETALKNKYLDYIVRDWTGIQPGDLVIGDNRTFDTRVHIFDPATQKVISVRPTICALIDARSWYIVAWEISPVAINSWDIANVLAQYVGRYGVPPARGAYFDNGKDFCAQGFSTPLVTPDGYQHSIFNELGMSLTNSIPYNARAKTVERVFRDQMQQFDKLFADYLGSKPEQRTMAAAYFDNHPEELPSLNQFCQAFTRWLEEWHDKPKNGRIHNGESPAEIWERREQRTGLSEDQYRMAFAMPVGVRRVGRGPAVSLGKVLYYCDDLKFDEMVLLKRDHLEPDLVHIYTTDGAFIGFGRPRAPINAMVEGSAEQKRLADLIARQRHQLKTKKTALKMLTGGMHVISAMELLDAPTGAKLLRMGEIGSVKGSSHRYVRYELAGPETRKRLPEAQPLPRVASQNEPVDQELLALIHEARHPGIQQDAPLNTDLRSVLATAEQGNGDEADFRALYAVSDEEK